MPLLMPLLMPLMPPMPAHVAPAGCAPPGCRRFVNPQLYPTPTACIRGIMQQQVGIDMYCCGPSGRELGFEGAWVPADTAPHVCHAGMLLRYHALPGHGRATTFHCRHDALQLLLPALDMPPPCMAPSHARAASHRAGHASLPLPFTGRARPVQRLGSAVGTTRYVHACRHASCAAWMSGHALGL